MGRAGATLNRWKFAEHVDPTKVVVDFGCGGGWLLARLPAARRIGVEPIEGARDVAAAQGLDVVRSAAELAATADAVISNHALQHTTAPLQELKELRRALRPGGRIVLWLPLEDWRVERRPKPNPGHHLYTWTSSCSATCSRRRGSPCASAAS